MHPAHCPSSQCTLRIYLFTTNWGKSNNGGVDQMYHRIFQKHTQYPMHSVQCAPSTHLNAPASISCLWFKLDYFHQYLGTIDGVLANLQVKFSIICNMSWGRIFANYLHKLVGKTSCLWSMSDLIWLNSTFAGKQNDKGLCMCCETFETHKHKDLHISLAWAGKIIFDNYLANFWDNVQSTYMAMGIFLKHWSSKNVCGQ